VVSRVLIDGGAALQRHEVAYVERLKDQTAVVSGNVKVDGKLIAALDTASGNLENTPEAEAKQGLVSGKVGRSFVYATLKNAADGMAAKGVSLAKRQEGREEALMRVQDAIEEAVPLSGRIVIRAEEPRGEKGERSGHAEAAA
jgi:hypothetical protein